MMTLLFLQEMGKHLIYFPFHTINWFAWCLMMPLSDSQEFIGPNMLTDCHLMGKKKILKVREKLGWATTLNTTISPSDNTPRQPEAPEQQDPVFSVVFQWLTHNDCSDSKQHKRIPKQVIFNILLCDVLHFLLGQECAFTDSLLESLHPASHPGLFSVAFSHSWPL